MDEDGNTKIFALQQFLVNLGNNRRLRQEKYFYGTIGVIFDYEDAIKALVITDTEIINRSALTLYLKVDGERITVAPRATYQL
ncbi:MAG: hypothetical protein IKJ13_00255 [Clostridia bacterium]|nr:hypothetical protein [Clostridia bacterium]